MYITTKLRVLRLKYGISLEELAEFGEVSNQVFSHMELNPARRTAYKEQMAESALGALIAQRKSALAGLEREYQASCGNLLIPVEVDDDEL